MSAQEKERIEGHARKCRLSVSEYLRKLAAGHTPNEIPSDNFYSVARNLEFIIEVCRNKDDESFSHMLRKCVDELYDVYILPARSEE